jgi:hypothetical protein
MPVSWLAETIIWGVTNRPNVAVGDDYQAVVGVVLPSYISPVGHAADVISRGTGAVPARAVRSCF